MSTTTIEPLSEHTHPYGMQRDYGPNTPATFRRTEGDQALLAALERACNAHARGGERPRVGELPERELEDAVRETEHVTSGRWRLSGVEGLPLIDRLDQHFRPPQEARQEQAAAAAALAERRAEGQRQREEEFTRAWRGQRILDMVSELQAMDALDEMRETLEERAALEGHD